jgi:hypothetical protein|tara:strand:- start:10194 stop:10376 length:183 start_codon:yes stop_codon:yes gene_type:complete
MGCAHCGKGFTCGCQKTKTSDGKTVHKKCLTAITGKSVKKPIRKNESIRKYERARRSNTN